MQGEFEFCGEQRAKSREREPLFFCVFPPAETSLFISEFAERFIREKRLSGRRIKTGRLHISLHLVGDYTRAPTRFLYKAQRIGNSVSIRPFEVICPSIMCFRPDGSGQWKLILHAQGDGLLELQAMLGPSAGRDGRKAANRFPLHMTLLYGFTPIPFQKIEPIRFVVEEFALVHSESGFTRYNVLERWPLHAAA
jgi:2'-5' RNA ligase